MNNRHVILAGDALYSNCKRSEQQCENYIIGLLNPMLKNLIIAERTFPKVMFNFYQNKLIKPIASLSTSILARYMYI